MLKVGVAVKEADLVKDIESFQDLELLAEKVSNVLFVKDPLVVLDGADDFVPMCDAVDEIDCVCEGLVRDVVIDATVWDVLSDFLCDFDTLSESVRVNVAEDEEERDLRLGDNTLVATEEVGDIDVLVDVCNVVVFTGDAVPGAASTITTVSTKPSMHC